MNDRPKESYLAWFREILANYKIIAMIIVLLGGYSATNLYDDLGMGEPVKVPLEPEANWEPTGNQPVPLTPSQVAKIDAINTLAADITRLENILKKHDHPEQSVEAVLAEHLEKSHIKDHRELHQ